MYVCIKSKEIEKNIISKMYYNDLVIHLIFLPISLSCSFHNILLYNNILLRNVNNIDYSLRNILL